MKLKSPHFDKLKSLTKKQKKLILAGIALLLLILAACYTVFIAPLLQKEQWIYKEETVERGTLKVGVTESGSLEYNTKSIDYDLNLDVSDDDEDDSEEDDDDTVQKYLKIEEIYAASGQRVTEGEELLKFTEDSVEAVRALLQNAVVEAQADYAAAESTYELSLLEAQTDYDTQKISASYAASIRNTSGTSVTNKVASLQVQLEQKQANTASLQEKLTQAQEDYQDDSFIIADVSRSDINAIDKTKDTIVEKDYLLEGSGESNETWQKSLDYVVDGAWDVKAIHAENADLPKKVTKKVKIAVLDSGADKFSAGQLAGSVNFVNPDEDGFGNDATGHGTAVQNVILSDGETTKSVLEDNKAVELYSVKVLDENNQAPISRIIAAINWCIDNGMNVVNMSFGTLAKSQILQDAIERADKAGVLLIAAAGNSGEADGSTVEYPAAYPQVLGVGSVNQKMEVSEFSSRGKGVDLVAPGENVPVTVPWGFYGVQSGTSFAAPHVTAVAGILWAQNRSKTSAEIASLLRASANAAWDEQEAGNGIVDLDYAEQVADTYQVSAENKVSQSNEDQLTEYAVPTVVQARWAAHAVEGGMQYLSLIHISEPTRH